MRSLTNLALACLLSLPMWAEQSPPPAGTADRYPAHASDAAGRVIIAADPYNTAQKQSIFRLRYTSGAILPIRIIITNNGDSPISLNRAVIDLVTAAGDRIPAAEPADAERALDRPPDPRNRIPIGPFKVGGRGRDDDRKIEEDFKEFEYSALAVEPHATRSGFLFYNVDGLEEPLAGTRLELRHVLGGDGRELFAFEIPLDRSVAGK
jgi:hypothetical protein